jgi:hypothetical protein
MYHCSSAISPQETISDKLSVLSDFSWHYTNSHITTKISQRCFLFSRIWMQRFDSSVVSSYCVSIESSSTGKARKNQYPMSSNIAGSQQKESPRETRRIASYITVTAAYEGGNATINA